MKQALGLIETIGLVTAIEAADAAVKAADITLLGYENTKGSGKITLKFVGGVGAVQAAVAAGVAAAARIGKVYGHHVIPRPHDEIEALIRSVDRGRKSASAVVEVESAPAALATAPEPAAPEAETVEPEAETAVVKQCAAITKSGEPCKLPAQPDSDYCFVHRPQSDKEA
ncbi:MAG: BMC domain-containing protein [Anaerolinea sp.]|nr:BMC domain-containing protein [Anaerolinea sp.]